MKVFLKYFPYNVHTSQSLRKDFKILIKILKSILRIYFIIILLFFRFLLGDSLSHLDCEVLPKVLLLIKYTHGCINVTTLLVKHYNDLLDRRSSGRGRDTVTCFYVGDVFCIYLGTLYADFQKKSSLKRLGKSSKLFIVVLSSNF